MNEAISRAMQSVLVAYRARKRATAHCEFLRAQFEAANEAASAAHRNYEGALSELAHLIAASSDEDLRP